MVSNTDLIYLELPFLGNVIPRAKVQQATVRRWDDSFLGEHSISTEEFAAFVTEIRFLDGEGLTISIVGKRTIWQYLKEGGWYQSAGWYKHENVAQALTRIGDKAKRVKYAIKLDGGIFTVYKLPNGFSNAAEWVLSEMEILQNRTSNSMMQ